MKILQRYILREHIAPFLFALFIITFLLIIEYVPKIVDQVIDKDLSVWVVLELIGLNLAWMLALSVPMSVLVATLMAFGRLTSDFEVTAIKSSGINLLQMLIPLLVAASLLTAGMIWFNDAVLPDLNKRARLLWGDISAMRPTLVFRSGIFITEIPGYLVQVDKIDHSTSRVEGVRITETKNPAKPRLIIAEYGFLKSLDNGKNLQFTLYNGELHSFDVETPANYRKVDFQDQVINISGTGSELVRTETDYRTDREMPIDTMQRHVLSNLEQIKPLQASSINSLRERFTRLYSDTFAVQGAGVITDSAALVLAKTDAMVQLRTIERNLQQIETRRKVAAKFQIEIYKKYSIPAASLAFVLIGAPLAIMTRKGGMGIAISISIALFIIYWAFLIGGEDLADRGLVSPFIAMWGANILLGAIGIYLIYVVVTEKPVFAYFRRVPKT
ncbi:MAG: LptF/LptG family permease [candidate division Zixibacteria bacterium]|nr:LptF/LptG family permease [candidate division Zixibacteria bacterium]